MLTLQVNVSSNRVVGGTRTVVLTRAFAGITPAHYTFSTATASVPVIDAVGTGPDLAFHKARGTAALVLEAANGATCVCDGGTKGTINGLAFEKTCAPEPTGDLLQQRNPTCWIQSYGACEAL